MAERTTASGLIVPPGRRGPDPMLQTFMRRNSGGGPALIALARRDLDELRERWQDEASEAALSGNPERARYIETWIARLG